MPPTFNRRIFLGGAAAGLGLAGFLESPSHPRAAGEKLVVVQWGAGWIEVSKKLAEPYMKDTGDQIAWELHAGGAMAIDPSALLRDADARLCAPFG